MSDLTKNLPDSPGVYLFKGARGKILYVGKAGNLKRRVSSYFRAPHSSKSGVGQKTGDPTSPRLRGAGDSKTEKLIAETKSIDYEETDTAIEALILEAELIKKHEPQYNVREKDDKSFLYVEITREEFPRVLLIRGKDAVYGKGAVVFGPFTSASSIRAALGIIRRIFPYSTHDPERIGKFKRMCFDAQIGLCPGTCVGGISKSEYAKNIRNIKLFLSGGKGRIINGLEKEMETAANKLDFERANKIKRQIFALKHIQDTALIMQDELPATHYSLPTRIEGYDISNISGTSAVGSMAVFINGSPANSEYRLFKIYTIKQANDVGMLKEMLERRFRHMEWGLPDIILVDGGQGQVQVAKSVISGYGLKLPVLGIAKGPTRRKNEFIGKIPNGVDETTLIRLRDEAHRSAISYHRKVRKKAFLQK